MEREQIGKAVLDYHFYTGEDKYTDGAIEDEMLEIAKNCAPEAVSYTHLTLPTICSV